jgi:hypothetical protein
LAKSTALARVLSRTRAVWEGRARTSAASDAKAVSVPRNEKTSAGDPADVVAGRVVAYHVCRWNVSETLSPQSFVSNVASQLCRSVCGFAEELRRDPQTLKLLRASLSASDIAFREAVLKPLTAALSKGPLRLVLC